MVKKTPTTHNIGESGRRLRVRKPLIQARGLGMQQGEQILRAAIWLARVRDSGSRNHAYRIRAASKVIELLNAFIKEEVEAATSVSKSDPAYLSWEQVGQCLNLSKSAVYSRYGKR